MNTYISFLSKKIIALFMIVAFVCGGYVQSQAAFEERSSGKDSNISNQASSKGHKFSSTNTQYGKLQKKLKEIGLYNGEITGRKNAETIDALKSYQKQNGLKITGTMSKETREKMGLVSASKIKKS